MRQLHRAVNLGFPEFTGHLRPNSLLATAILARYPTARSFARVSIPELARLAYDRRHHVSEALARALIEGAKCGGKLVAVRRNPWSRAPRPLGGCGEAAEGRICRLYAEVARRDLQRRAQPSSLRAPFGHSWT